MVGHGSRAQPVAHSNPAIVGVGSVRVRRYVRRQRAFLGQVAFAKLRPLRAILETKATNECTGLIEGAITPQAGCDSSSAQPITFTRPSFARVGQAGCSRYVRRQRPFVREVAFAELTPFGTTPETKSSNKDAGLIIWAILPREFGDRSRAQPVAHS